MSIKNIRLSDGKEIPAMVFGTYQTGKAGRDVNSLAIEAGYRFFDTASLYETERALGNAIKNCGLKRSDFIIQSKLWLDERGYKEAKDALERSLDRLGTDYLDIYLIHWPRSAEEDESKWQEKNLETVRALIEAKKEGLIKGIGLSNFLPHHIAPLMEGSKELEPLVDQLEIHIGYIQQNAVNYCKDKDIVVQAWSPLGRGKLNLDKGLGALEDIAARHERSIHQICLRYLIEKGIVPVVKAADPTHMRSNMEIFDFSLTFEEVSLLDSFPYNTWLGEHPDFAVPNAKSNFNQ